MDYKVGDKVQEGVIHQIFSEDLPEPIFIVVDEDGTERHLLQNQLHFDESSTWLKCTKCNKPLEPEFTPKHHRRKGDTDYLHQVTGGMEVKFLGGYGEFYDQGGFDVSKHTAILCHDCMVDLLEWFPESFQKMFIGGHPYSCGQPRGIPNKTPCCKYGWTHETGALNGN